MNNQSDTLWFFTERYFRVLEFAIILGALGYLKSRIDVIIIDVIYWITWGVFFVFCRYTAEYFINSVFGQKFSKYKILSLLLSFIFTMCLYLTLMILGLELAQNTSITDTTQ